MFDKGEILGGVNMNIYEAIVIFDASISTKAQISKIKKYNDILQDWCKTKKVKVDDMGVKKLAYPVKKIHTEGYYVRFLFKAEPENIAELERLFRIDDYVIKFLTVRLDEDEEELEDYIPNDEKPLTSSEQEKPDALDVLLGFAEYKKKGVEK